MPSKGRNKTFGFQGEKIASQILSSQGFKILSRNFHCFFGEVDIVALKDSTLYFFEVKSRISKKFGEPFEAVTFKKIQKIKKIAAIYTKVNKMQNFLQTIGVVSLYFAPNLNLLKSKIIFVE